MGDRRGKIRKLLHPLYLPYYDALCGELHEEWQPYFGYRTLKQQELLYAQGRTSPGSIVTHAKPGASPHNYGMATDWTIFDEEIPLWLKKDDYRWKPYQQACEKVGLVWGGDFLSIADYYHNELKLKTSWREVKRVYDEKGIDSAYKYIESNL